MLKAFDIFPKFTDRGAKIRTFSGGIISIGITVWIFFLISSEIKSFLKPHIKSSIQISSDSISGSQKVFISFDILINTSCPSIHLDLFEDDGRTQTDIIENITRIRMDQTGTPIETVMERFYKQKLYSENESRSAGCGSCYAAAERGVCCNTCHDVMEAFRKKGWSFYGADRWQQCKREGYLNFGHEKCQLKGSIKIKRGSGHFHFGLGSNLMAGKEHIHDLSNIKNYPSLNHTINTFLVGEKLPDFRSPLDQINVELIDDVSNSNQTKKLWVISYFLHLVPASYISTKKQINSYRYSAMYSQKIQNPSSEKGLPGIHFFYDFEPIRVVTTKFHTSMREFITHVGGIIGGAFSFAAIFDAFMYSAASTIEGKYNLNKYL